MSAGGTPRILLVVGGGIAAYKSCELVRLIRKAGGDVTCVVTAGGQQFVTPMALAALSENPVHTTLWDLKNEAEMGHIQLSREADLVVVCPATADLLAKMAAGIADDLATTLILATDKPVMAVPAMNVRMWQHDATQRNVTWLRQAGVRVVEPDVGPMACGEFGPGRMPDPEAIWAQIAEIFGMAHDYVAPAVEDYDGEGDSDFEEDIEALEPEPEIAARGGGFGGGFGGGSGGGLGGLLASLIPRSTPKRAAEEIEQEWLEMPDGAWPEEGVPAPETGAETGAEAEAEAEAVIEPAAELAKPGFSSPLLATKGKAASAPPTDPEAMNHLVITGAGKAAPQPIEGDEHRITIGDGGAEESGNGANVEGENAEERLEFDPLYGQPDFDTDPEHRPLYGKHVLITAGPTHEPIDPVRYIANRSSGRQGFAIAAAAANAGARVTLVAGPVTLATPHGVDRIDVESAREMDAAVKNALPVDVAIMVAAVADWRTRDFIAEKMKKRGSAPPALRLMENPDILASVAAGTKRPGLLIGFAAETQDVLENAKMKRKRKGVDWIVANDVSGDVMGGDRNRVNIVTEAGVETLDDMPKADVARALIERVADALADKVNDDD
ncbi:bifunctional phosphopantothenoylcysteine decarboxylase/phosphopantothenate synthase [Altererythrobacter confluentis]|uniref:Coenzyme A biosynthesis bifunctional protein CoaBC n=1 Tax=Allopontixanthobacter confluentis TaxID=1849021 RepID=A0A6L7GJ73_9SPHN|nr:bifunctional phosphopantothenoylcysteine decarboxylase/phosphopantothenate synthase [Allopontixanthobacter confluentis]MXP15556.1 bifunctional phosphopantothenoylcysteine decarboxylase/phosphopantothenate synthase [Allopontixanthobacter confluentis]